MAVRTRSSATPEPTEPPPETKSAEPAPPPVAAVPTTTQTPGTVAPVIPIGTATTPRHTQASPKILSGTLSADPTARFTPSGKLVATLRVTEETKGDRPPAAWTVKAWNGLGEQASEGLRKGDAIKVIGSWEPDREYERAGAEPGEKKSWSSHDVTARDIGVLIGDKTIPLGQFDRDALTPHAPDGLTAGGMSAAD